MSWETAVLWIGAFSTLAIYSVLYKENPVYRVAEHVFLGIATGYGLFVVWKDVLYPMWYKPFIVERQWAWIFALVAGLMYYTVYSKKLAWMSRVIMTTMMGLAAGLAFREFFGAWVPQIGKSFKPLYVSVNNEAGQFDLAQTIISSATNIIFVAVLICVMAYFFFSFEHKNRVAKGSAYMGRWLMMICFGAMFGSTIMARMSLFIGRLDFLFRDWIPLIK